ncbi:S-adenosyl-L-methionine-dependent methyltransferase [Pyronema domesticum]|nr:S-adenosyl-L-methionine-dependent methyltransferase [Pyronema domesticum]
MSRIHTRRIIGEMSIEVDPTVLENPEDEDYLSAGYDTSTASLSSSVHEYLFEHGRRYHAYYGTDKYLIPTDEKEQDRLDLHHESLPPLNAPHKILDLGTGTGIWAIDMAEKYPMAQVIGTDLSPIQPTWVPSNCRFEMDDAMMNWTFQSNSFDFIHARNIAAGISSWQHVMSEIMRCLKPGAYAELMEMEIKPHCDDGTMTAENGLKVYTDYLRASMEKMGRPPLDMDSMRRLLEESGFEDIQMLQAKESVGPWPKDPKMKRIGAMALLNADTIYESYGMAAFTRVLEMDTEKARSICEAGRAAARSKNFHVYTK